MDSDTAVGTPREHDGAYGGPARDSEAGSEARAVGR